MLHQHLGTNYRKQTYINRHQCAGSESSQHEPSRGETDVGRTEIASRSEKRRSATHSVVKGKMSTWIKTRSIEKLFNLVKLSTLLL